MRGIKSDLGTKLRTKKKRLHNIVSDQVCHSYHSLVKRTGTLRPWRPITVGELIVFRLGYRSLAVSCI